MVRTLLRTYLDTAGMVVTAVGNGEEALAELESAVPDVMLIDRDLPGMSGIELLRVLGFRLSRTKIVMLTPSASEAEAMEVIMLGACGYLSKDMTGDVVRRVVRSVGRGDLAMSRSTAARAMRGLARLAARVGSGGPDDFAQLSTRELEILHLIAGGLRDREIAARLHLSPRTVEKHVSAMLRKLGCSGRSEAAARYGGWQARMAVDGPTLPLMSNNPT